MNPTFMNTGAAAETANFPWAFKTPWKRAAIETRKM